MTQTCWKRVQLDNPQKGLDQSCHESLCDVPKILVVRLCDVLWDLNCWTDRLSHAEPQQQHSYCGPEGPSTTLMPPTPHALT